MTTPTLRTELESLLDLDEMRVLARDWLGFEAPGAVTKASFAEALLRHATDSHSVEALCDAVATHCGAVNGSVAKIRRHGFDVTEGLGPGSALGDYRLTEVLGHGPSATVFAATNGISRFRIKVLGRRAAQIRESASRYLALARASGGKLDVGLPELRFAGQLDGKTALVHVLPAGRPLAGSRALKDPKKLREVWPDVRPLLQALSALHSRRLVHGDIRGENVLFTDDSTRKVSLLDAGAHFLRTPTTATSPEQARGELPTPRSDLYAFGLLLYEFLSGQAPFPGSPADLVEGMLAREPSPLSFVMPPGLVEPELDELVLDLLDRRPEARPSDAESVIDTLGAIATRTGRRKSYYPEAELESLASRLLAKPEDTLVAGLLEAAVDSGADPGAVASTLLSAADRLEAKGEKRRLVLRAAALLETTGDTDATAAAYRRLLAEDPEEEAAWAGLERLHRERGAYDHVAEVLVERIERMTRPTEQARVLVRLAHVLETKLDDPHQALIALTHAFRDDPSNETIRGGIERLAGRSASSWNEVLATATEAVKQEHAPDRRHALLLPMSKWYAERAGRPDLAKRCLETILLADPAHDAALEALSFIHRSARDFEALAATLVLRAQAAVAPTLARDLRMEAASVLERDLGDRKRAASLYEQVVAEDPGNVAANEALCRVYEEVGAKNHVIRTLTQWIPSADPALAAGLLVRLGRLLEGTQDLAHALEAYESAFEKDGARAEAVAGVERVASKLGQHEREKTALEQQLRLATSPRQRVALLERLARLFSVELLDDKSAAMMLERILEIEPAHASITRLAPLYEKLGQWEDLVRAIDREVRALPRGRARAERLVALAETLEQRLGNLPAAAAAYESAVDMDPKLEAALDGMARLGASTGDASRAAAALDALAKESDTAEGRGRNFVRAGELLEKLGDVEGAIDRYLHAMEARPSDETAGKRLRALYLARGDIGTVISLLERGMANGGSDAARAELGVELARLLVENKKDLGGAEAVALRVVALDPSRAEAHAILGNAARASGRIDEAVKHYAAAARHVVGLPEDEAVALLSSYADVLSSAGDSEKALSVATELVTRFPTHRTAGECAADIAFRHGTRERAVELYRELIGRFEGQSSNSDRSRFEHRLGEALSGAGRIDEAIAALERASSLDPETTAPLRTLRAIHESQHDVAAVARVMKRHLERARGDEKIDLLVEIGDLAASSMNEPGVAEESYLEALSERPSDRRVLLKLVELYTKGRDWARLVDTVVRLSEVAPDGEQRAKRLLVAARVALEELGDRGRALDLVGRALDLAPESNDVALEAISLLSTAGDTEGLRILLEQQIQAASRMADRQKALELGKRLAELHLSELHVDEAISVYEAVARIGGTSPELEELLADLYASDPRRYMRRAEELQARVIARDPYREAAYRALLRLHTDARNRDGAFCSCQALVAIERASAEEERYFGKHRSSGDVPAGSRLTDEDLKKLVIHPQADPLITAVFSRIQAAMILSRGKPLAKLGHGPESLVDPGSPSSLVRAVVRASDLLGMRTPVLVQSARQKTAVALVHADERCLSLGQAALTSRVEPREASFVAAAHLAYFLPGFAARGVAPTVPALKAWLTAAIRLFAPRLAVPPEIEGSTAEATHTLKRHVKGAAMDWLAEPVSELLHRSAAADVATWVAGIDQTSDRLGFIVCGDLPTALSAIRAARESSTGVPTAERVRELIAYSVSAEYLDLRQRLRMDLDHEAEPEQLEALAETEFSELV